MPGICLAWNHMLAILEWIHIHSCFFCFPELKPNKQRSQEAKRNNFLVQNVTNHSLFLPFCKTMWMLVWIEIKDNKFVPIFKKNVQCLISQRVWYFTQIFIYVPFDNHKVEMKINFYQWYYIRNALYLWSNYKWSFETIQRLEIGSISVLIRIKGNKTVYSLIEYITLKSQSLYLFTSWHLHGNISQEYLQLVKGFNSVLTEMFYILAGIRNILLKFKFKKFEWTSWVDDELQTFVLLKVWIKLTRTSRINLQQI